MKIFYTYLWLREDGTPYYVGKGSGCRAFTAHGHTCHPPKKDFILVQEFSDEESAYAAEIFLVSFYGRIDKGGCLRNLTDGGDCPPNMRGFKHSLETRRKVSDSLMGNKNSLGRKATQEELIKKSVAQTGKKYSAEARQHMKIEQQEVARRKRAA